MEILRTVTEWALPGPGVPVLRDGHDRGSAAGRARGLGVVRAGAERGGGAADLLTETYRLRVPRIRSARRARPGAVARCARCGQDRPPEARSAHYARLSDRTVREHWEKARKVNAEGQPVQVSPGGPLGDAAWSKHHLSRATQALPNGYCQLQLVKTCPHANSCFLTCPMFVTTAEFLRSTAPSVPRLAATACSSPRRWHVHSPRRR